MFTYPSLLNQNIFSQQTTNANDFYTKTCQIVNYLIQQTNDKIIKKITSQQYLSTVNDKYQQCKQIIIQNKQIIIGIGLVSTIYFVLKNTTKNYKNDNSRLNSKQKSNKKYKPNNKKSNNHKLSNLKSFISQEQQQLYAEGNSQQSDKQLHNLSTSTKRTQSILSDIQPSRKKKMKQQLEPIADIAGEDDQQNDKVFFQVYKTYMNS